ncbi:DNA cytosine methyltransferase, partial [Allochromatium vinosum]|uniref:DNA cytosine methyltransferase n=1 Tax=Allochromatium vinosum TaxID=1049 RepID=UPI0030B83162
MAEIEPFPRRVLAHHYPNVPNLGDVTKVTEADIAALGQIDLVVFGSPCQDLSVAGKRKGLAGARSGLFFTAINIIQWARLWG